MVCRTRTSSIPSSGSDSTPRSTSKSRKSQRDPARVWRTVTPAALPEAAGRRRIDPARVQAEARTGTERAAEHARATEAVQQALRHTDVRARAESIRVQREPFDLGGERAELFAAGTRFSKERMWHVEVTLDRGVAGPLTLGDGRFLGLGVMRPVEQRVGLFVFAIEGGLLSAEPLAITRALRRAVMARVQGVIGPRRELPRFFSGHEANGSPARSGSHDHLAFAFDPGQSRLLIIAPYLLTRQPIERREADNLRVLHDALVGFNDLRAGSAGRLVLRP
ncbi:MAG TPA: type I-U CRISPR-associated protein Csb2 [Vicinamibacterales bacterium]|nr:type I-U CRISPR-associated protein Csb2 [Vicinamibacterales bacterium]